MAQDEVESGQSDGASSSPNGAQKSNIHLRSNRLPITIKKTDEPGKWETNMSSGGLVTGLSGMTKTTKFIWYGWPGLEVPEDQVDDLKKQLKDEYDAIPVMLDDHLADRHYNGMASELRIHPPPTNEY
jgi:trehalose 6-phosphate synthase